MIKKKGVKMKNLILIGLSLAIFTGCAHNHKNVVLEIVAEYNSGGVTQQILADKFGVKTDHNFQYFNWLFLEYSDRDTKETT